MASHNAKVAIACITFRRTDGVERLLDSFLALQPPGADWIMSGIVVVDNDPNGSAEDVVSRTAPNATYVIEPEPGISAARNRAVEVARTLGANWIAFADDDETVRAAWVRELCDVASTSDCAAVVGAVEMHFPDGTPTWFQATRVFQSEYVDGEQTAGYFSTNNCLIRIDPMPVTGTMFDPRFGLTGGSDWHLGRRIIAVGQRVAYAPKAFADEVVVQSRITLRYAVERLIRYGNTLVLVDRAIAAEAGRSGLAIRFRAIVAGTARVGFGLGKGLVGLRGGLPGLANGLRTSAIGLGQLGAALDLRVREYRRTKAA